MATSTYFEIEVSLKELKPRIWRRFLLRTTATFLDLHQAIQDSFGWDGYHLWEFRQSFRGDVIAGVPSEMDDSMDAWGGEPTPDAPKVRLTRNFTTDPGVQKCLYIYDFGDYWQHEVKVRKVVTIEAKFKRHLVDGARACPPEDCGGPYGYQEYVDILALSPEDLTKDHRDHLEWFGSLKPEAFDFEGARQAFDR